MRFKHPLDLVRGLLVRALTYWATEALLLKRWPFVTIYIVMVKCLKKQLSGKIKVLGFPMLSSHCALLSQILQGSFRIFYDLPRSSRIILWVSVSSGIFQIFLGSTWISQDLSSSQGIFNHIPRPLRISQDIKAYLRILKELLGTPSQSLDTW